MSAHNLGKLRGEQKSPLPVIHRGESMQLLQEGLHDLNPENIDGLIHAVALSMTFELRSVFFCLSSRRRPLIGFQ